MTVRRPLLRIAAVGGAAVLALGLAGCGDVDAGSGALDDLHALVDGWDETIAVDESASNTLPWSGTASATVVLDPETVDDRVDDLASQLGDFVTEADGGTATWFFVDLQIGSFRVNLSADESQRAQVLEAFDTLRSDERVVGAFLGAGEDRLVSDGSDTDGTDTDTDVVRTPMIVPDTVRTVRAVVVDDVPLTEAFAIVRTAADRVERFRDEAVVAVSEDGGSAVSDSPDLGGGSSRTAPPLPALALASAIGSVSPVRDVVATGSALDVRLESSESVTAVLERFGPRASELSIDLTVNGGDVTDDGTAGIGALTVARSLDGLEGIDSVEVSGEDLRIEAADASVLDTIVETLGAQPDIGSVRLVTVTDGESPEPGFSLAAPPADLERLALLVAAIGAEPTVVRIDASESLIEFSIPADPDVDSLRSIFTATRPILREGDAVQISADRNGGFTNDVAFTVAETIDVRLPPGANDEVTSLAGLVATAWATS